MELFLTHWAAVEALVGVLPVGPLPPAEGGPVLQERADLEQLQTDLRAARAAVTEESVVLSVRRGTVRDQMAAVLGRFNQFAAGVRGRYAGRAFARALPGAPCVGDAPGTFLKAAEKAEVVWSAINATPGALPLTVGPGTPADPAYGLAAFALDLAALRTAATDIHKSEQRLKTLIEMRNDVQDIVKALLRGYRRAVAGRLGEDHALVASLPRYSPRPGKRPAGASPLKTSPPGSPPAAGAPRPACDRRRRGPRGPGACV